MCQLSFFSFVLFSLQTKLEFKSDAIFESKKWFTDGINQEMLHFIL